MKLLRYRLVMKRPWLAGLLMLLACVDPIDFEVPPAYEQIVVEGQITDAPGPYSVKLSKAISISEKPETPEPITNALVTLFDDKGSSEVLTSQGNGLYLTSGVMRGQVGNRYHIRIELDGKIFESEPDLLTPVGEVKEIRYEYEGRMKTSPQGEQQRDDRFNIFIDADAGPGEEKFVRWRFMGTYKVVTNPELHMTWLQGEFYFKTPLECSGYVVVPFIPGGKLEQRTECTCCTCWANHYETAPQLSDTQFVKDGKFNNVKVGEVPITTATFYNKYLVYVEQISMSRSAFEFFKLIRQQKEGALSLFQPPSAEIKGNIRAVNTATPVVGIFYASSISSKKIFINRDAVPYNLQPIDLATEECYHYYENASTEKPTLWED
ncbi:MAG TPA: DUF4249 domain-containing protein [Chryseosolibacter sp.]